MHYQKPTIDDIVTRLETASTDDPLILPRFCDGEWACMNGVSGRNCDEARFTPALGRALWAAWWYFLSQQSMGKANTMPHIHQSTFSNLVGRCIQQVDTWRNEGLTIYDSSWTEPAVESGEICKLLRALRKKAVLVGPAILEPVAVLAGWGFVSCHHEDAFAEMAEIIALVLSGCQADSIILCCGMAAEPLAMRLNIESPWRNILDLGAILDPLGGRKSRGYQRNLTDDQVNRMKEALTGKGA